MASSSNATPNTKALSKIEKCKMAEEKIVPFLKPSFTRGLISKETYKDIMRKCVGKICDQTHINNKEISELVESHVNMHILKL